jgi:prepilin-type N-terminal cleavage/methylation domain-containing protein
MLRKKAFTLIELLVVIAIIAMLLSIIVPALRKAKDYARKVICQSNYKQIGVVLGTYESATGYNFRNYKTSVGMSDLKRHWFWKNGTGDMAHESVPYVFQNIFESDMLPDLKVLFCPVIQNLSFEKNYVGSLVAGGIYTAMDTNSIIQQYGKRYGSGVDVDGPYFWSTYDWIWKKEVRDGITTVNNASSGAMMCDMTDGVLYGGKTTGALYNFLTAVGIRRSFQHCNVLMQDFSVVNPSDKDEEVNQWLWGSDTWPGHGGS